MSRRTRTPDLLPASARALDKWIGPVWVGWEGIRGSVTCLGWPVGESVAIVYGDPPRPEAVPLAAVSLELTVPTVRDRLLRVIAEELGMSPAGCPVLVVVARRDHGNHSVTLMDCHEEEETFHAPGWEDEEEGESPLWGLDKLDPDATEAEAQAFVIRLLWAHVVAPTRSSGGV